MTPDLEIWAVTDDWSSSEQIVGHGVCTLINSTYSTLFYIKICMFLVVRYCYCTVLIYMYRNRACTC